MFPQKHNCKGQRRESQGHYWTFSSHCQSCHPEDGRMQKPLPVYTAGDWVAGWFLQVPLSAEPACQLPQLVTEEPLGFPSPPDLTPMCPPGQEGLHKDPGNRCDQEPLGLQLLCPKVEGERRGNGSSTPRNSIWQEAGTGARLPPQPVGVHRAPTPYGCCSGAKNTTVTKQARSLLSQNLRE